MVYRLKQNTCKKEESMIARREGSTRGIARPGCKVFVKLLANIRNVGQCLISIPFAFVLSSLIQEYLMSICLDLGPAEDLLFDSNLIPLLLSCSK